MVGDSQEVFVCCGWDRFECLFEFAIGIDGGSPFIVPGHGIATETSLHGKCSWPRAVITVLFPVPVFRGS